MELCFFLYRCRQNLLGIKAIISYGWIWILLSNYSPEYETFNIIPWMPAIILLKLAQGVFITPCYYQLSRKHPHLFTFVIFGPIEYHLKNLFFICVLITDISNILVYTPLCEAAQNSGWQSICSSLKLTNVVILILEVIDELRNLYPELIAIPSEDGDQTPEHIDMNGEFNVEQPPPLYEDIEPPPPSYQDLLENEDVDIYDSNMTRSSQSDDTDYSLQDQEHNLKQRLTPVT